MVVSDHGTAMHTTSASLLMRLKQPGQPEAWARFVRTYSPLLYAWAYRLGLQEADAADLVQEVFAALLEKLPTFDYDGQQRFRGWLWTLARNKWREKRRLWSVKLEASRPIEAIPAEPDESLEELEFHRHVVATLLPTIEKHFKPDTWKAFWKHMVEGRPAGEVADEMGIDVNAVYVAKCRVLSRLHKEMGELNEE